MKSVAMVALGALCAFSLANGGEIKSGLQAGKNVGAFYVTKVAGAEKDGVKAGKNLCYRCMNGGRPQVMVFTRSTDKKVMEMLATIDTAIAKDSKKQLRAFVNVLGEDKEQLAELAKKAAKDSKTKNIPFVVPNEFENGPDNYGLNSKAEVTVLMVSGGKVKANYAVAKAKDLDTKVVAMGLAKMVGKEKEAKPAKGKKTAMKSGLQTGKNVGAFYVTKVAGAEKDGVKVGKNLCYRCMNGGRPQVMVFTRSTDQKVMEMLASIDTAIAKDEKKQLRAFVNVLGEDKEKVAEVAKKAAKDSKTKNIPFVVPNEFENGPDNYGLNSKAEVTVLMVSGGKVKANYAVAKAKDLDAKAVVKDLQKIMKK